MPPGPSLVVAALVLLPAAAGCGSGFSGDGFDRIQEGETADAVESELGEPNSTQSFGEGSEIWVYCDGPTPHYLAMTDEQVAIADLSPPDELRLSEPACD